MNILQRIAETKRTELAVRKRDRSIDELKERIGSVDPPRDFAAAVAGGSRDTVRLIAEIKKASPSAGIIVADFDPAGIAGAYYCHGAAALSVLTDETYFHGHLDHIREVRRAVPLPVLRKDFLIDEYQVYESRAAESDAVLLIAELLDAAQIDHLAGRARELGMTVLVEVHGEQKLATVMDTLGPPGVNRYLLGINNRNLTAQTTDITTMARLAVRLPKGTRFVAESGLSTREDVLAAQRAGAGAILVGESLLRAKSIGAKIDELLGRA